MDEHGYPTVEELNKITRWPYTDGAKGWFTYIMSKWKYAADGYWTESLFIDPQGRSPEHIYAISTTGWSGNEDVIDAMKKNAMLWMSSWYSSRRGGHYEFRVKPQFMEPRED